MNPWWLRVGKHWELRERILSESDVAGYNNPGRSRGLRLDWWE
jgi:hypothetical protein